MKFFVYNKERMAQAQHAEPHIIISILTPGAPFDAKLPISEKTRGILRLRFHDIDTEDKSEDFREYIRLSNIPEEELFTEDHAGQILSFVRPLIAGDLESILVHCEAGVSRSPAVAAGLAHALFNQDPTEYFKRYTPNKRVYVTLLKAAGLLKGEGEFK